MKTFRIYVLRPVLLLWALGLIWFQSEEIVTLRHDNQFLWSDDQFWMEARVSDCKVDEVKFGADGTKQAVVYECKVAPGDVRKMEEK